MRSYILCTSFVLPLHSVRKVPATYLGVSVLPLTKPVWICPTFEAPQYQYNLLVVVIAEVFFLEDLLLVTVIYYQLLQYH